MNISDAGGSKPIDSYLSCAFSDSASNFTDTMDSARSSGGENSSPYRLGSSWVDTSQKSQNSIYLRDYNKDVVDTNNNCVFLDESEDVNSPLQSSSADPSASNERLNSNICNNDYSVSSSKGSLHSSTTQSILSYSAKILRYAQDKYYFPYFTIIISLVNWAIFLWFGYQVGYNHIKQMSPIIPTDRSFWFIPCTSYPQCQFLKNEIWRLFTYSLCHSGWLHIASNTIFILGYATVLEPLCENGLLLAVLSYIFGVLFGALGHNLLEPFTGVVGASAGAYGIFGSVTAVSVLDKTSPMIQKFQVIIRFAVFVQLLFELIYPLIRYNPTISYSSHFFGFIFGLMISTNIIVFTHRKSFPRTLQLISALTLFAVSFALLYCYRIKVINVDSYVPFATPPSCCGDMFKMAAQSNASLDSIRNEYICQNSALKEYGYYYYTYDDNQDHNNDYNNNNNNFISPTKSPSFEQIVDEYSNTVVKIS